MDDCAATRHLFSASLMMTIVPMQIRKRARTCQGAESNKVSNMARYYISERLIKLSFIKDAKNFNAFINDNSAQKGSRVNHYELKSDDFVVRPFSYLHNLY
jgi:hypothetical protein